MDAAASQKPVAVGDLVSAVFRVTAVNQTPAGHTVLRLEPAEAHGPPQWEQVVWLDARTVAAAGGA